MYLTRALFPKPTLSVTARGGAVSWSCLIFLFLPQGTVIVCDKSPTSVQYNSTSYYTVLNEVMASEKCPPMTVKTSKVLFTNAFIYCVIFFLQL